MYSASDGKLGRKVINGKKMLILLLLGLLGAFFLQWILYEKNWKKGLDVTLKFQDAWIYEGEKSELKEVIKNDKLLPIPALEVGIVMGRNLRFDKEAEMNSNVTDQSYKRDIFSFLFHQQITRTLPFKAKKRGVYEIKTARVVANDWLFRNRYYEEYAQQTSMYVYPKQVDTKRIQILCRALSGMIASKNRLYEDPFEFAGIREYQKEDPMNRVNWKMSARMGKWMVNQFDATTSIEITILLDVEEDKNLREEEQIEESIRIASSLAARLIREKMGVCIKSNAMDEEKQEKLNLSLVAGAGRCAVLNRKLAQIKIENVIESGEKFLLEEARQEKAGQIYIVVSKNQRDKMQQAVRLLSGKDNEVLWVVPFLPREKLLALKRQRVSVIGWEVTK